MFARHLFLTLCLALSALPALAERVEVKLGNRSYLADLPQAVAGAPMILALHGGGGNPAQFARSSGLSPAANRAGFAVVYPAGTGRTGLLTWNAGSCCGLAQRTAVDDLSYLDAVAADAVRRFGLNGDRLYVTGMSNGAMMAAAYAAERPGNVRAAAPVAGTLDLVRHPPKGAVPLLHIHGTADARVPYAGGRGQTGLTRTDFASVAEVIAAFRAHHGPLVESRSVIDQRDDATRAIVQDWARGSRTMLRLITIEGGGHLWPGGLRAPRQDGPTREISATAEILRFFAIHP